MIESAFEGLELFRDGRIEEIFGVPSNIVVPIGLCNGFPRASRDQVHSLHLSVSFLLGYEVETEDVFEIVTVVGEEFFETVGYGRFEGLEIFKSTMGA
jgi:hypothetical protein